MFIAVRTGLEPATPCVTGMYSNQAELPHQSFLLLCGWFRLNCANISAIFFSNCAIFSEEILHLTQNRPVAQHYNSRGCIKIIIPMWQ